MRPMVAGLLIGLMGCKDKDGDSGAPATFAEVRDEILVPSCGFSTCHGTGTGGLTLDEDLTAADLVGVAASGDPTASLVVEGDPDASYLLQKMRGDSGIVGTVMPPSGALDAETVGRVEAWIAAGAPP